MVRTSVYIAISMDGFIAREDGGIDWLALVERPGEDHGYAGFFAQIDALVMGRKTYDTASGFPSWPYAGKRVVVLTHRAIASREGVETFAGDPRELLAKLERQGVKRAYVDGGDVIRQLIAADLVDDLILSVIPILLGAGIRLFGNGEKLWTLESSRAFPSGLVQLGYLRSDMNQG